MIFSRSSRRDYRRKARFSTVSCKISVKEKWSCKENAGIHNALEKWKKDERILSIVSSVIFAHLYFCCYAYWLLHQTIAQTERVCKNYLKRAKSKAVFFLLSFFFIVILNKKKIFFIYFQQNLYFSYCQNYRESYFCNKRHANGKCLWK